MRARVAEKVENCIDSLTLSLSEKAKAFPALLPTKGHLMVYSL